MKTSFLGCSLLFFFIGAFGCTQTQAASVCLRETCVDVEIVSKLEDMQRGLQERSDLKENHGMLFVFNEDDFQRFWMKDMKFSIDMVWIDSQQRIVTIASARPPCAKDPCEVYSPSEKARYVLEVPKDFVVQHHFMVGDVLKFNGVSI